ncbi:RDD family protein [Desulfuribacillus stibiiarsenatis]|nr:RDD family protein [Desulfuribacillus stibiiarsenatis]
MMKFRVAGFWIRFLAYVIDLMAIGFLTTIILWVISQVVDISTWNVSLLEVGAISVGVIGFLYFVLFTKLSSQTLGKLMFGLQVIRQDGAPLDWLTVLIREVAGRTVSQLFGSHIGYLWIAFHPQKTSWHDMFADTYVIYEKDLENKRWISIDR